MEKIYELKLGEKYIRGNHERWERVPGGWIVSFYDEANKTTSHIFVRYNNEFAPKDTSLPF